MSTNQETLQLRCTLTFDIPVVGERVGSSSTPVSTANFTPDVAQYLSAIGLLMLRGNSERVVPGDEYNVKISGKKGQEILFVLKTKLRK